MTTTFVRSGRIEVMAGWLICENDNSGTALSSITVPATNRPRGLRHNHSIFISL